ncbi:unnamed protein product, partial [marine sediment metagenome]
MSMAAPTIEFGRHHDIDAEEATLGSMMLEVEALHTGLEMLTAGDFYRIPHQIVFDALAALAQRNVPLGIRTVTDQLGKHDKLDEIGGEPYLWALVDSVPTAANMEHYADIVKRHARLRQQESLAIELGNFARMPDADPARVRDWLAEQLRDFGPPEDVVPAARLFALQDLLLGEVPDIAWTVEGLVPRHGISLLAGDSSSYKTWLMLHLALVS